MHCNLSRRHTEPVIFCSNWDARARIEVCQPISCCLITFLPRCMECRRGLAMRILSVRLSVRPSVKRMDCDKTKEKSYQIQCETAFSLIFLEKMVVGGDPFHLKFWINRPRWSEIADFEPIIARSALAVRPAKKSSINTNRKSTTRFPTSLRWSSYVAPKSPKGGSKKQNGRFPSKSHFAWRKSATKFLCVKNVSDKVVRHSFA